MKTHKVGQDIYYSSRHNEPVKFGMPKGFWIFTAITSSFFLSQAVVLFLGK